MDSLVKRAHRKLLRIFRPLAGFATLAVTFAGRKFRVPVVENTHCDVSELWMIDVLRGFLLARRGTFIDVGVNIWPNATYGEGHRAQPRLRWLRT